MKTYSVRPAASDDLIKIQAIESRVHRAPWTLGHFEQEISKSFSHTWVLTDDESDEEMIGYAVFWQMDQTIELLNIAVDSAFQKQGFAKKILQKIISLGVKKQLKAVKLDVRKSNGAAIQLYQSLGFVILHMRKAFYSDGEAAYHLSLDLSGMSQTNSSLH